MDLHNARTFPLILICTVFLSLEAKNPSYIISSVLSAPYLTESQGVDGNNTYHGYIKDLLEEMRRITPFDYTFRVDNTTFGSVIQDVIDGRSDLVACPLTITYTRINRVDFSVPFQTTAVSIVLRQPEEETEPVGERLTRLYKPFESSVWLLIFLSMLATGIVLYIISYFNPYEWRRMMHDKEATIREGESFTCLNSFWFVVSASMLQGYIRSPRSLGGRIVVMVWWWFTILVISCYIANLSNFLRTPPSTSRLQQYVKIRSLEDLSNSDVPVAIIKKGATNHLFDDSPLPHIRRLRIRMQKEGSQYVSDIAEGLQFVRSAKGQKAFVTEVHMSMKADKACDLYTVQDYLFTRRYAFAFKLNSSLLASFNFAITKLQDTGKLSELERTWLRSECTKFVFDESKSEEFRIPEFHQVNLTQISGLLLVLAVGFIAGAIITLLEVLIYKYAEMEPEENTNQRDVQMRTSDNDQDGAADNLLIEKSKEQTTV